MDLFNGSRSQQIIWLNYTLILVCVCYFLISHTPSIERRVVSVAFCNDGRIKHFDDINGKYVAEQQLKQLRREEKRELGGTGYIINQRRPEFSLVCVRVVNGVV